MPLSAGTRLGVYEVTAQIGAGGMGEVYRALDTKLKRHVAIKVLSSSLAADPDRLARFQREAEVLASLNHPNIAALYGLEEGQAGPAFLVMELVDGDDLSQRIGRGRIPIDEALSIARQIAEALDAAHAQGIIHRDLKPANIKVRPDGTVKVLDFGLAKAMDVGAGGPGGPGPAGGDLSQSPTLSRHATMAGVILGTAAYMAPEQARGKAVDRRADIWAFGAVLFEMLTGQRAFDGEDMTEVLGAVVRLEPNWQALSSDVPPLICTLLQSCLVKDSRRRVADISTALFVLDKAAGVAMPGGTMSLASPNRGQLWRRVAVLIAGALLVGAIVGDYWLRSAPAEGPFRFSMNPPEGTSFLHVSQGGAPALSPDGSRVAFVAAGPGGHLLWVCTLDGFNARVLAGTDGAMSPFWSADGRSIGFFSQKGLQKVDPESGQVQVMFSGSPASFSTGTWNADGEILFTPRVIGNVLEQINASGGQAAGATQRNVELLDENHQAPSFLPDGRHYLLLVRGGPQLNWGLWLGVLGSNDRRLLLSGVSNAQYAPPRLGAPGYLVFAKNNNLMAQPFDAGRGTLSGEAVTVAEHVAAVGLADFTVSAAGVLAYRTSDPAPHELIWYDRSGKEVGTIGDRAGNPRNNLRISPDGKAVAFTRQAGETQEIWIHDLVRGVTSRLSSTEGRSPVWSPDGSQIAFVRQDAIYRMPATGAGAEELVWRGPHVISVNDWSGDGKHLLFTRWDDMGVRQTWLLSEPMAVATTHEAVLLTNGIHAQFAPSTGAPQWICYDDGGQSHIRAMPGGVPGTWQVSTDAGNGTRFRRDGRELYFASGKNLVAVEVDAGPLYRAHAPHVLFPLPRAIGTGQGQYAQGYDVTADGSRFLATFPAPETPATTMTVVRNWQARLSK